MQFERLLLLWDELDELAGAIRHGYLHFAHDVKGLAEALGDWAATGLGGETTTEVAALPEASTEA